MFKRMFSIPSLSQLCSLSSVDLSQRSPQKVNAFFSESSSRSFAYATRIAVLLSALSVGRLWARCMLGSDLTPRFHPCCDGTWGCWGCYLSRDLLDQHSERSHPNMAADVVLARTPRKSLGSPSH